MKTNDYVRFITQEMVKRMDQPRDILEEEKARKKQEREPRASKWFGMIPMSISLWMKKHLKRKELK